MWGWGKLWEWSSVIMLVCSVISTAVGLFRWYRDVRKAPAVSTTIAYENDSHTQLPSQQRNILSTACGIMTFIGIGLFLSTLCIMPFWFYHDYTHAYNDHHYHLSYWREEGIRLRGLAEKEPAFMGIPQYHEWKWNASMTNETIDARSHEHGVRHILIDHLQMIKEYYLPGYSWWNDHTDYGAISLIETIRSPLFIGVIGGLCAMVLYLCISCMSHVAARHVIVTPLPSQLPSRIHKKKPSFDDPFIIRPTDEYVNSTQNQIKWDALDAFSIYNKPQSI